MSVKRQTRIDREMYVVVVCMTEGGGEVVGLGEVELIIGETRSERGTLTMSPGTTLAS